MANEVAVRPCIIGDLSVRGGVGGIRASQEDLGNLHTRMSVVAHNLAEAEASLVRAELSLHDQPVEIRLLVEEVQAATAYARHGPLGAATLQERADELHAGLALAKREYSDAEKRVESEQHRGLSSFPLFRAFDQAVAAAGRYVPGFGLAMEGRVFINRVLVELGWSTFVEGETIRPAELLRRMHPTTVGLLSGLSSFYGAGFGGNTTSVAGGASNIITFFTGVTPISVAKDREIGAVHVPRGAADIVSGIDEVRTTQTDDEAKIAIEKVIHPDGTIAWIVEIPGTKTQSLGDAGNPLDNAGNLAAEGQNPTQMGAAVGRALMLAGAKMGEAVMLAGHSQGGIVAAGLAADKAFTSNFTVKSVITVGSPVSEIAIPKNISMLSFQHDEDIIPALSGTLNPDAANRVTVSRSLAQSVDPHERDTVTGDKAWKNATSAHDLRKYRKTAQLADNSDNISVAAWRAASSVFFAKEASATRSVYSVKRERQPKNEQRPTPMPGSPPMPGP